ncbi:hypothetical protein BBO99_00000253 [Phytophthora kernoviae]|uniref:Uncharacterized protein n=1 Tax=Phytophthora kernoviae TaxID=325452 RepID=A0A421H357_9STRA|nr:hypothetical protein JM18_005839 [Phytophthora kernoviae]RLN85751.1 hypothetical protein BBO99_00000253 [Phytophthora kernoviae]
MVQFWCGTLPLELTPSFAAQLEGKILANAHAEGDVDGDGATELLFGSILGNVFVFKNVALNICHVVHLNGELIIATRDGRVFVYKADTEHSDSNEVVEYSQLTQLEISNEIESLLVLHSTLSNPDASSQLLARCFSGEVFCIKSPSTNSPLGKRDVVPWSGPPHDKLGVTFIVGDIELGGHRDMVAIVSMTGLVSLFSSTGERQWDVQLPEAVVSADKLEMIAASGNPEDAIVVCTWSGQLYAIQSERSLVRFRMLLAASSMFCVNIRDSVTQTDPTIVGISTSGSIFVYRDVQETLIRGLQDSTLADTVRKSTLFAQMDTPKKRGALISKLREAYPQSFTKTKTSNNVTAEELISALVAVPIQP